jgi:fucose 4-O-acetylase-like acetyltransferase
MAATVIGTAAPEPQFPFMTFGAPSFAGALVISALASAWYLPVALLAFRAFSRWPAPAVVGWLARGALIIMLLHMPIFFAINPVLADMGWPYAVRVAVELAISLGVLGWVSATLTAAIQPKRLAERLGAVVAAQMTGWRSPSLETR